MMILDACIFSTSLDIEGGRVSSLDGTRRPIFQNFQK